MNEEIRTLEQIKHTVITLAIQFGPKLVVAVVLIFVGVFVGRWIGQITDSGLKRIHLEPPVRQLLVRIVRIVIVGLFTIMSLQNLGVELLPLIAGLGVAGAGVALAMQGVLGNIVAGLSIIFTKPFRIGEYVSIAGEEGQVESISLFTTVLNHPDLSQVVIPNRKIVGEILHNYGQTRQLEIVVGVARDTDLAQALAAIETVLRDNPKCLRDPAPPVAVSGFAAGAINITARPWVAVADYAATAGNVRKAIVETFRGRNIAMPPPQREIRMVGNLP